MREGDGATTGEKDVSHGKGLGPALQGVNYLQSASSQWILVIDRMNNATAEGVFNELLGIVDERKSEFVGIVVPRDSGDPAADTISALREFAMLHHIELDRQRTADQQISQVVRHLAEKEPPTQLVFFYPRPQSNSKEELIEEAALSTFVNNDLRLDGKTGYGAKAVIFSPQSFDELPTRVVIHPKI